MAEMMMNIDVLRYRPEEDAEPWWQSFKVPYSHETSLLDALSHIKDHWSSAVAHAGPPIRN